MSLLSSQAPQKGCNRNSSHHNCSTNAFQEIWEDPKAHKAYWLTQNTQRNFIFNSNFLIFFIVFPSTKQSLCLWISLNVDVPKETRVWKMWLMFLINSHYKTWPWKWKEMKSFSPLNFLSGQRLVLLIQQLGPSTWKIMSLSKQYQQLGF